jgi:hypothetical protein
MIFLVIMVILVQVAVISGLTSRLSLTSKDYKKPKELITGVSEQWRKGESDYFDQSLVNQCSERLGLKGRKVPGCHIEMMNCLLSLNESRQDRFSFRRFRNNQVSYYLSPLNEYHSKIDSAGLLIEFKDHELNKKRQIFLKDSCAEVLLPERKYGYPVDPAKVLGFYWDNVGKKIYVDQHLVTNREVAQWLKMDKEYKLKSPKVNITPDELPSESLYGPDMKRFCQFKGKKLMKARYWYAAALNPGELSLQFPLKIFRYPYPWTKDKKKSFLYQSGADDSYKLTELDCTKAYVKGCDVYKNYDRYRELSLSWSGMKELLGGAFEHWDNDVNDAHNMKSSSRHFASSSVKHQLGHMGRWSKRGFNFRDYSWDEEDVVDLKTGVAFRCFRERL